MYAPGNKNTVSLNPAIGLCTHCINKQTPVTLARPDLTLKAKAIPQCNG